MELYTFNNLQLGGVKDNYKLIPLKIVKIFESLANYYDISRKSRGLEKPTKSDKGFLQLYKELNGKWEKMKSLPVKKNKQFREVSPISILFSTGFAIESL